MEELREMYKHINIPIVNRVLNIEQGRSIVDAYI
jgi:pyoverdine/dityrosine biosynthesis protein Dit1